MQARRRRLAASLGAGVALLGLTGCQKPTPIVTLYSGGSAIHDSAFVYCFDGQDPAKQPGQPGACRYDADRPAMTLEVKPGDPVLVDVDKDLADAGWVVTLGPKGGPSSRLATQDGHTSSFQPDFNSAPQQIVQVRKLESPRADARVLGLWQFELVPR
jgi:hypothetical protein